MFHNIYDRRLHRVYKMNVCNEIWIYILCEIKVATMFLRLNLLTQNNLHKNIILPKLVVTFPFLSRSRKDNRLLGKYFSNNGGCPAQWRHKIFIPTFVAHSQTSLIHLTSPPYECNIHTKIEGLQVWKSIGEISSLYIERKLCRRATVYRLKVSF